MRNCVRTYGEAVANGDARLWSVRREGARASPLWKSAVWEGALCRPSANFAWPRTMRRQRTCGSPCIAGSMRTRVYAASRAGAVEHADRTIWRQLWKPFWLAKLACPAGCPCRHPGTCFTAPETTAFPGLTRPLRFLKSRHTKLRPSNRGAEHARVRSGFCGHGDDSLRRLRGRWSACARQTGRH